MKFPVIAETPSYIPPGDILVLLQVSRSLLLSTELFCMKSVMDSKGVMDRKGVLELKQEKMRRLRCNVYSGLI
jgi:hypothetical protein